MCEPSDTLVIYMFVHTTLKANTRSLIRDRLLLLKAITTLVPEAPFSSFKGKAETQMLPMRTTGFSPLTKEESINLGVDKGYMLSSQLPPLGGESGGEKEEREERERETETSSS